MSGEFRLNRRQLACTTATALVEVTQNSSIPISGGDGIGAHGISVKSFKAAPRSPFHGRLESGITICRW